MKLIVTAANRGNAISWFVAVYSATASCCLPMTEEQRQGERQITTLLPPNDEREIACVYLRHRLEFCQLGLEQCPINRAKFEQAASTSTGVTVVPSVC
jgi:hypothetical protein